MTDFTSNNPDSSDEPTPIAALLGKGRTTRYDKGELLIRSNEENRRIYYLIEGFVKVYSMNNRGESYVQLVYGKGDIFPIGWMIDEPVHNLIFEAETAVTVRSMAHNDFLKAINHDIALSHSMLEQTIAQFVAYVDRLDNLQYKYVQERLIYRLLFLAKRFGEPSQDGIIIQAPTAQKLIANSINASRENVSRELERLQRKNLVKYVDKKIVIPDMNALRQQIPGQVNL